RTAEILSNAPVGALVATICRLIELPDDRSALSGAGAEHKSSSGDSAKPLSDPSDVISIDEAAAILLIRRERLIRNQARYPFVKLVSRKHFVGSRSGRCVGLPAARILPAEAE